MPRLPLVALHGEPGPTARSPAPASLPQPSVLSTGQNVIALQKCMLASTCESLSGCPIGQLPIVLVPASLTSCSNWQKWKLNVNSAHETGRLLLPSALQLSRSIVQACRKIVPRFLKMLLTPEEAASRVDTAGGPGVTLREHLMKEMVQNYDDYFCCHNPTTCAAHVSHRASDTEVCGYDWLRTDHMLDALQSLF